MTTRQEVRVPDIGDFDDVEIVDVMVNAGDSVAAEDSLITLETDKAAMDVPAPMDGKIVEMSVGVGDKVSEGSLVLVMEASGEVPADSQDEIPQEEPAPAEEPPKAAEPRKPAPPPLA